MATGSLEQVYGYHPQPLSDDRPTVVFQGKGVCSQMPLLSMEIVHTEYYDHHLLAIGSGRFRLAGSAGEELFGTYTGRVAMTGDQMSLYQEWTIEGGEGKFRGARGTLAAEMHSSDVDLQQFAVRISGIIFQPPQ